MCYSCPTKMKSGAGPPSDTRVKVTLVARPLLTPVAQKLCRCEHGVFMSRNVCSLSNITSHRNRSLLFVKHLAMHIVTRKHRIRPTGNTVSGHRKCLSVSRAHRATKQLKSRPYRFQAVHQLQQRDTAARIQY
jgi:hypothetical protein